MTDKEIAGQMLLRLNTLRKEQPNSPWININMMVGILQVVRKYDKYEGAKMTEKILKEKHICGMCKGFKEIATSTARQMGYTYGFEEDINSLEENIIQCPECQGKE